MINKKSLTVAVVESLSIYLVNIIFVYKMYMTVGFFWSAFILMVARIVWFYFLLELANKYYERIKLYFSDLIEKARK